MMKSFVLKIFYYMIFSYLTICNAIPAQRPPSESIIYTREINVTAEANVLGSAKDGSWEPLIKAEAIAKSKNRSARIVYVRLDYKATADDVVFSAFDSESGSEVFLIMTRHWNDPVRYPTWPDAPSLLPSDYILPPKLKYFFASGPVVGFGDAQHILRTSGVYMDGSIGYYQKTEVYEMQGPERDVWYHYSEGVVAKYATVRVNSRTGELVKGAPVAATSDSLASTGNLTTGGVDTIL